MSQQGDGDKVLYWYAGCSWSVRHEVSVLIVKDIAGGISKICFRESFLRISAAIVYIMGMGISICSCRTPACRKAGNKFCTSTGANFTSPPTCWFRKPKGQTSQLEPIAIVTDWIYLVPNHHARWSSRSLFVTIIKAHSLG